jgi:hypothetical protein
MFRKDKDILEVIVKEFSSDERIFGIITFFGVCFGV